MRSLGLDVGGTNVKLVVLEDGEVVERREAPTLSEEGPERTLRRLVELARAGGEVDTVGVALPGLVDDDGTAVLLPNLHGDWTGLQLRAPLEAGLGRAVTLINDGHAFALAESLLGAGRGAANVIGIACGTGIGGGLVLDGRLHLGPAARAGEFGHHTVAEDGLPCECGNRGCLELYAGARAIAAAAGAPTFDDALARARAGDEPAREALRRAGELIGVALANVLIFVCPDRAVVGGGVAAAGELLFEPLLGSVRDRARVAPLDRIAIVAAELGPYAGAVGAALAGGRES
ncbi:MAG TPA: ROK family protein [Gaiellaceae bacterium]|nr:ROK family protein [Gaiellaceae bacterium]